ncbi:MAG: TetR/AcrR family transcriptional regulator [Candidatus Eremiobacteraeota bacterium]|nr:TetR/AcrR family transcriptional regulator [Candidatus Eremiobacteraeota bacterium]
MPRIHGRPTADHIAEVAGRLFYSEGIHEIGVDRIAMVANVTKRTLYRHFPSKDHLLAAALRRESPLGIRECLGPADYRVDEVFRQVVEFVSSPEFRGCPFINAAAQLPNPLHPARAAIRETRERRRLWFRARVVELGALDPELLADKLMVLFDGALAGATIRMSVAPAYAAADAASALIRGVTCHQKAS